MKNEKYKCGICNEVKIYYAMYGFDLCGLCAIQMDGAQVAAYNRQLRERGKV
jgi:hypothetical protein